MKKLNEKASDLQKEITAYKGELIKAINKLPNNPRIEFQGDDQNCFTMSSKDLGTDNWSPEYHNFKKQHGYVIQAILDAPNIQLIASLFQAIISKGKIRKDNYKTVHFHPDVVEQFKQFI